MRRDGGGAPHAIFPCASRSSAKPGAGSRPCSARRPVGTLGIGQLAAQPVQLALLVEGEAERRVAGSDSRRQARSASADGLGPGTVRLQDLRAVHEALTAVGHEVGLGRAPAVQCAVHSAARRRSNAAMHDSITAQ